MRLKGLVILHALCVLVLCLSISASAQEQEGISIGQIKILPSIGLTWGHDDNITFAGDPDNDVTVSSDFYIVSPGVRLELPSDRSILAVTWTGEWSHYETSEIDDYDDWNLRAAWDYDPSSRTSLGVFGNYREGHDRRGTGRTQGNEGLEEFEPDEYNLISYGGYFDYGAVGARGRLEVEASRLDREYTNNREYTRALDREDSHLGATFLYRIRPKTSLVFEAAITDIAYDFKQPEISKLDSTETRFLIGLDWDASARTSGRIEYGILEKDFDAPEYLDYDDDTWKAAIEWRPRTYSTFTLTATKETDEQQGEFGQYVLREDISLSWTHYWATKFNTIIEYGVGTDEHEPDFRKDDLTYWGIGGRWQINQYLQLGLSYNDYKRESGVDEFNYTRGVWLLTLEGSL